MSDRDELTLIRAIVAWMCAQQLGEGDLEVGDDLLGCLVTWAREHDADWTDRLFDKLDSIGERPGSSMRRVQLAQFAIQAIADAMNVAPPNREDLPEAFRDARTAARKSTTGSIPTHRVIGPSTPS